MGIYTTAGRNLRATSLIERNAFWLILGRPNSMVWDGTPPEEDPSLVFPDEDSDGLINTIGYKRAETVSTVLPDPDGQIYFDGGVLGTRWSFDFSGLSPYLYLRFLVEYTDFTTPVLDGEALTSFRRLTVVSNPVPPPGGLTSFQYGHLVSYPFVTDTVYIQNTLITPAVENNHLYYVSSTGQSGETEPIWPTTSNSSVTSGSLILTEYGTKTSIEDRRGRSFFTTNIEETSRLFSSNERQAFELILLS